MRVRRDRVGLLALALVMVLPVGMAKAQNCSDDGSGFDRWLSQFQSQGAGQGFSAATARSALAGISYDTNVIRLDRNQRSFKLSFDEFYRRRVSTSLLNRGRQMLQTHRATFNRVEQRYGVPGEIIVSIWGLETNYGADRGQGKSILRSLATLAYDCRRSDFFRNELVNALRIIDRGDIPAAQMTGGWAGEIGPMQFLPSSYVKYAVDFDGDGRRDLFNSVPDMLASTANFLRSSGWQPGQPFGPGSANWAALQAWNKAEVYQRTIAAMAEQLRQPAPERSQRKR